jgi:hypothetical protein
VANDIVITVSGDTKKLVDDLQKYVKVLETANTKLRENAKAGGDAARAIQTGFAGSIRSADGMAKAIANIGKSDREAEQIAKRRLAAQKAASVEVQAQIKSEKDANERAISEKQKLLERAAASVAAFNRKLTAERNAQLRHELDTEAAHQQRRMQIGKALTDRLSTAQERYNKTIADYRRLLRIGAIDQQTFNRGLAEARRQLADTGIAAGGLGKLFGGGGGGDDGGGGGLGFINGMIGRLGAMAAAYLNVRRAIQFVTDANRDQMRAAEDAMRKQEEMVLRFRAQGGLDAKQGRVTKGSIYKSAIKTSATSDEAYAAATALESTGFDPKIASEEALVPFLKLKMAQAIDEKNKGVSDQQMAESTVKFLTGTNQPKTGENMATLAAQIQGLQETPMKMVDLPYLARHSETLSAAGMTPEDQLATFAHMIGTEDSEMAGTHLRLIVNNLAEIRNRPKETKLLRKIGLKPDDVDLAGEDLFTALERIDAGIKKLPAGQQTAAWDELFEQRSAADARRLAHSRADVDRLRPKMRDRGVLERDFATVSTGKLATERREKTKLEMLKAANDVDSANDRLKYEVELNKRFPGNSPFNRTRRAAGMAVFDAADSTIGHEALMHNAAAQGNNPDLTMEIARRQVQAERDRLQAESIIEAGRQEVKANAAVPQAAPPPINVGVQINMPGQGAKAPAVPAAGLGRGG